MELFEGNLSARTSNAETAATFKEHHITAQEPGAKVMQYQITVINVSLPHA
ncbi:hypothetical protein L195_g025680 [Trifolium pratense]|uniref:Uncharacterized protein n=1 Tax=Trifolium pratense TaxID=57577 RepID=A0A2K3NH82_TRIPR|nr:hypothetical protein L195_g025680 [Trifolium pratense]